MNKGPSKIVLGLPAGRVWRRTLYLRFLEKKPPAFIVDTCTFFDVVGSFVVETCTFIDAVGSFAVETCTFVDVVGSFAVVTCTFVDNDDILDFRWYSFGVVVGKFCPNGTNFLFNFGKTVAKIRSGVAKIEYVWC